MYVARCSYIVSDISLAIKILIMIGTKHKQSLVKQCRYNYFVKPTYANYYITLQSIYYKNFEFKRKWQGIIIKVKKQVAS